MSELVARVEAALPTGWSFMGVLRIYDDRDGTWAWEAFAHNRPAQLQDPRLLMAGNKPRALGATPSDALLSLATKLEETP